MTKPRRSELRSKDLAELAGVTVRTLRHYHQIGLLPEPDRATNGYRRYTVQHLATVLRIVSFTDIGVPLEEVRKVIDDPTAAMPVLDQIDSHAADEIQRLATRRRRIAQLRAADAPPDLPAALLPYARLLWPQQGRHLNDAVFDREQLALIDRFTRTTGLSWLAAALKNLSPTATGHMAVMDEFRTLADDASAEQIQAVVDDIADLIATAIPAATVPELDPEAAALLLAHQEAHFTGAQRLVWDRLLRSLDPARFAPNGEQSM